MLEILAGIFGLKTQLNCTKNNLEELVRGKYDKYIKKYPEFLEYKKFIEKYIKESKKNQNPPKISEKMQEPSGNQRNLVEDIVLTAATSLLAMMNITKK